jgi:hypothetical protein
VVLKSPPRSPKANATCERVIGTIRRERLDWLIPRSASHLRSMLNEWVTHYNQSRPHMALGPGVPDPHPRLCSLRLSYPGIRSASASCCAKNRCWAGCITNINRRSPARDAILRTTGEAIGVPLNDDAMAVLSEEKGKHPERVFTCKGRPIVG